MTLALLRAAVWTVAAAEAMLAVQKVVVNSVVQLGAAKSADGRLVHEMWTADGTQDSQGSAIRSCAYRNLQRTCPISRKL